MGYKQNKEWGYTKSDTAGCCLGIYLLGIIVLYLFLIPEPGNTILSG